MKLTALVATATIVAADFAGAATLDVNDFDTILTEGFRTASVTGDEFTGATPINPENRDVRLSDVTIAGPTLIAGRVTRTGNDRYDALGLDGPVSITVNSAPTSNNGDDDSSTTFSIFSGRNLIQAVTLGSDDDDDDDDDGGIQMFTFDTFTADGPIRIVARSQSGATDYDIGIGLAAIPLPAAATLSLLALGGLGLVGRRRKG